MTKQKYYDALTQQEVTEDFIKAQYEELTSKGDYFHDTYENFKNNNFKKIDTEAISWEQQPKTVTLTNELCSTLQCYDSDRTQYKPPHTRQKIGVYCTKAQKLEIELEFEFYERLFEEQQELFLSAFIQKQRIFPPDAPVSDAEPTERDIKVAFMAEAIERKTRAAMIESSEG